MDRQVNCECGYVARGRTDDEVIANVVVGDRLGLYRGLAGTGPATSAELAARTGTAAERVRFEVAPADAFTGTGYDLVATFDCIHDMGDPVATARQVRQALAPDGTWMLVEPYAADDVAGNLTPVGRVYYGFSTFLCVPHAVSEHAPDALGNQSGEAPMRRIAEAAGFTRFRRATETPFNIVYAVRR